jgi:hypothetical protein
VAPVLVLAVFGAAQAWSDSVVETLEGEPEWFRSSIHVRAEVSPPLVRIGERATYRARVTLPRGYAVKWGEAERAPDLTWGPPAARQRGGRMPPRRQGAARSQPGTPPSIVDTFWCEIPVQSFEPGRRVLAGLPFTVALPPQWGDRPFTHRVPQVPLDVVLTLSPADSNAQLQALHGPLAAPWWERVPWRWVIGALLALVLAFVLWRRLRRRGARSSCRGAESSRGTARGGAARGRSARRARVPAGPHPSHLPRVGGSGDAPR